MAGTRFTIGPMGANQFDKPKHQGIFFNWYIFAMYMATGISSTLIVYVENSVSWSLGFGICLVANILALAIFLAGSGFYHHLKPQGSPFVRLARVIVASFRKRKMVLSLKTEDYFQGPDTAGYKMATFPSKFFKLVYNQILFRSPLPLPSSDKAIRFKNQLINCFLKKMQVLKPRSPQSRRGNRTRWLHQTTLETMYSARCRRFQKDNQNFPPMVHGVLLVHPTRYFG